MYIICIIIWSNCYAIKTDLKADNFTNFVFLLIQWMQTFKRDPVAETIQHLCV